MIDPLAGTLGFDGIAARCWLLLAALAVDALVGDPDWLWRRVPHPVVLMGRWVGRLDRGLNHERAGELRRRAAGVLALLLLAGPAVGLGIALAFAARALPGGVGFGVEVAAVAVLLAQRSLFDHVGAVAEGLSRSLAAGRLAVSRIVGRNPDALDEAAVARAAIESAAENYSDGVVAPAVWYLAFGLPGIVAHKAINTADSMIGHRSPRHLAFGWASARLDDVVNLVPARLTALLIVPASLVVRRRDGGPRQVLRAVRRDAPRHHSPNAGWPESATAGALGVALAGPRRYGETWVEDGYQNRDGDPAATADDIGASVRLLAVAGLVGAVLLAVGGLLG